MPPDTAPNPQTTEELIQALRSHQAAMEALAVAAMQQELAAGNPRAAARFNQFIRQTQFNLKSLNEAEAAVSAMRSSSTK